MEGLRDRINVIRDHYRLSNRGFAEAIGAKPGERVIAMVQLGYFDKIPAKKTRKPAEEIVTFFGE